MAELEILRFQKNTGKNFSFNRRGLNLETSKVKRIFILTGEASGDKLAAKVIGNLNKLNPNIEYLSVSVVKI